MKNKNNLKNKILSGLLSATLLLTSCASNPMNSTKLKTNKGITYNIKNLICLEKEDELHVCSRDIAYQEKYVDNYYYFDHYYDDSYWNEYDWYFNDYSFYEYEYDYNYPSYDNNYDDWDSKEYDDQDYNNIWDFSYDDDDDYSYSWNDSYNDDKQEDDFWDFSYDDDDDYSYSWNDDYSDSYDDYWDSYDYDYGNNYWDSFDYETDDYSYTYDYDYEWNSYNIPNTAKPTKLGMQKRSNTRTYNIYEFYDVLTGEVICYDYEAPSLGYHISKLTDYISEEEAALYEYIIPEDDLYYLIENDVKTENTLTRKNSDSFGGTSNN